MHQLASKLLDSSKNLPTSISGLAAVFPPLVLVGSTFLCHFFYPRKKATQGVPGRPKHLSPGTIVGAWRHCPTWRQTVLKLSDVCIEGFLLPFKFFYPTPLSCTRGWMAPTGSLTTSTRGSQRMCRTHHCCGPTGWGGRRIGFLLAIFFPNQGSWNKSPILPPSRDSLPFFFRLSFDIPSFFLGLAIFCQSS